MGIKFRQVKFPKDEGKYLYLHKNGIWYVVLLIWRGGDLGYIRKLNGVEHFILLKNIERYVEDGWYWMKGA